MCRSCKQDVAFQWVPNSWVFFTIKFFFLFHKLNLILVISGRKTVFIVQISPLLIYYLSLNVSAWSCGRFMHSADCSDYCYPSFVYFLIKKRRVLPLFYYNFLQRLHKARANFSFTLPTPLHRVL